MLIKVIKVKETDLANYLYSLKNNLLITKENETDGNREYTFQLTQKLIEDMTNYFVIGYVMKNTYDYEIDDNKFMEGLKNELK